MPEEEKPQTVESLCLSKTTVGDQGAHWLRKALQRAKEQAVEESRRLEDVVSERWGVSWYTLSLYFKSEDFS